MAVAQLATAHYRRQAALARRAAADLDRLWRRVTPDEIARSWAAQSLPAVGVLRSAMMLAAASSSAYVDDVAGEYGLRDTPDGRPIAAAFGETASDGRDLASLIYHPAVAALEAIRDGASPRRALAAGRLSLDLIVRTQVADAGRTADQAAIVTRRSMTGYVRMVVGKTCPRCLILAGKRYEWNQDFQRHPRCDCRHAPVAEDVPDDVRTDPKAAFAAMSRDEQDRLFGKAGAESIRAGAGMAQVVNVRSGMYTAGGHSYTTAAAGSRPRLMPEQIYREAGTDRDEAVRLLRLHGYIR